MTSATDLPAEPLEGPGASSSVGLSVAAVARRIGVAPATLRTWDRRYGLGPTQHAAGSHRRYSATDIARLEHMRRLVLTGVPPAEAARAALAGTDLPPDEMSARPGGGQVVSIPGGTPQARGLARAAIALDGDACRQIVAETLDRRGVVWTWDHLIVPVLVGVGQRWAQTGRGIEVEHVLSESIQSVLSSRFARSPRQSPASVLLACAPNENHSLPLWALAAGLGERRVDVCMLGARTPWEALAQAIKRTRPGGVLVWSQSPATGATEALADLPDLRPEPTILLGGPGWSPGDLPRGEHVADLTEAIAVLSRAAGV